MDQSLDAKPGPAAARLGVRGSPRQGLVMGTWGFFIGFAAVALYGPAAHTFQLSDAALPGAGAGLAGRGPAAHRIPVAHPVRRLGRPSPAGACPMLTLFGISIVGMWGLVFILRHRPDH